MHRALGINLWNAHVLIKPLFADARMVLPPGSQQHLSEQLPRLLEILEGVIDINGDFSKQFTNRRREPAEQLKVETLAQVFLAGLRNKAAAIWLLTILPPNRVILWQPARYGYVWARSQYPNSVKRLKY
jgi:hypothetical protein